MSAYLTSPETVGMVAYLIKNQPAVTNCGESYYFLDKLSQEEIENIVVKVLDLNLESLKTKYPKYPATTEEWCGEPRSDFCCKAVMFARRNLSMKYGKAQMVKTLQCYLYQSCEIDKPFKNELYKAISNKLSNLALDMVSNTDAHKNASWGL